MHRVVFTFAVLLSTGVFASHNADLPTDELKRTEGPAKVENLSGVERYKIVKAMNYDELFQAFDEQFKKTDAHLKEYSKHPNKTLDVSFRGVLFDATKSMEKLQKDVRDPLIASPKDRALDFYSIKMVNKAIQLAELDLLLSYAEGKYSKSMIKGTVFSPLPGTMAYKLLRSSIDGPDFVNYFNALPTASDDKKVSVFFNSVSIMVDDKFNYVTDKMRSRRDKNGKY